MCQVALYRAGCCCALLLVGCSSHVALSGKIDVEDPFEYQEKKPPKGKVIVFSELTSRKYETEIAVDGSYSIAIPPGPARMALELELKATPLVGAKNMPTGLTALRNKAEQWDKLVKDHADIDRTPVKFRVEREPLVLDVTLRLPTK